MLSNSKPPKIVTIKEGDKVSFEIWQDSMKIHEFSSPRAYAEWWWEAGSPLKWLFPGRDG